jgi:hypothetical protein
MYEQMTFSWRLTRVTWLFTFQVYADETVKHTLNVGFLMAIVDARCAAGSVATVPLIVVNDPGLADTGSAKMHPVQPGR